jgi:hypothetical protein
VSDNQQTELRAAERKLTKCPGFIFEHPGGKCLGRCSATEGEFHRPGCDYARCTCGGLMLYCGRLPEPLHYPKKPEGVRFFSMHKQCCKRCGALHPDLFKVSDEVWKFYILSLGKSDPLVCLDCFNLIVELTDGGEFLKRHGGEPRMLAPLKRDPATGAVISGLNYPEASFRLT